MKISHLCLSCFYIDNFSYQENILPRQNKQDGHEVQIIASTETYTSDSRLGYLSPGRYNNEDGIPVVRLGYRKFLPHSIMKKLRMHHGVLELLEEFGPDVILFHGLCGWELLSVANFKKRHPQVRVYADSHEDANNSARNVLSRTVLHKIYYRTILNLALPYIRKILCVSLDTMDFVKNTYGIPESAMEFFPLGGIIDSDEEYNKKRTGIRNSLCLSDQHILIVQAGKMGTKKKILESLRAFQANNRDNLRLLLIGSFDDRIRDEAQSLLAASEYVSYLGWKESHELMDYLCAADVYLQPGSQSAIMQNAICHRCAVILDDVPSHKPFVQGNGWLLNSNIILSHVMDSISRNPAQLKQMSEASLAIARRLLDYKKLAARLYE
jgi:1,2-diacylglycerol 3-alpha-glucosyltransferase